jgi:hypothetical protein
LWDPVSAGDAKQAVDGGGGVGPGPIGNCGHRGLFDQLEGFLVAVGDGPWCAPGFARSAGLIAGDVVGVEELVLDRADHAE